MRTAAGSSVITGLARRATGFIEDNHHQASFRRRQGLWQEPSGRALPGLTTFAHPRRVTSARALC